MQKFEMTILHMPSSRNMDAYGDFRTWIIYLQGWLDEPEIEELDAWIEDARAFADEFLDETDRHYADLTLTLYEEQMKRRRKSPPTSDSTPCEKMIEPLPPVPTQEYLDALLQREQTVQRTEAWYMQAQTVVTASEVATLFTTGRTRAQLVMTKAQPYVPRNQSLAVTSDEMVAFDWGIRHEPLQKMIYEDMHGAVIKDLGRLVHPTDPRTSASPDGLVYEAKDHARRGRLVEFKAPVTREIIPNSIPSAYLAQMQLQLQVTGLDVCDFVEASFAGPYGSRPITEGPGWYSGYIAVVQREELVDGQGRYYVYSPLHAIDWVPALERETDVVVEIVPWRLMHWQEQVVRKSDEWWQALQPLLDSFWADVALAKQGSFVIPESTRPKKRAAENCQIIFRKLDEQGEPLIPPPPPTTAEISAIEL